MAKQQKILIVEDEVVVSEDIRVKLEKMGYEVPAIVRYGEKVPEVVRATMPDLILMDIKLKGQQDGIETAGKLAEEMDVPVIFLTSYTDQATVDRAEQITPFGYLIKPVRMEDLRVCLQISLYRATMEKKLKESELRFRTVADFTYDWETWLGPDNTYLYVSPSCERITGYNTTFFLDSIDNMYSIVVPEDLPAVKEHIASCHRKGDQKKHKLEFRIIRADGQTRWLEHLCQPVYSEKGAYLGRRANNRDISCRKKIEADRSRLIEELQQALDEVKKLSGLLPICSYCKRIRDDKGYWNQLEAYISNHSEAKFSHGICRECAQKHYPGFF